MTLASPPTAAPPELSREEIARYSRHLMLPEVNLDGQRKLKAARVLVIGTGGLGAPVSMYLAAAGVGRIGLVDFDTVDLSNLQRQILFDTADVGQSKTQRAARRLTAINPYLKVDVHDVRFCADNALKFIEPYDLVIDGTDNFPTRYCTNDACVMLGKPNVYGSIFRFEGQATVFDPREAHSPCYRCLYPEPPPPGMVPSCAEGGVLGILPGVVGCIQATEAIKLILGVGQTLVGRLLRYSALDMTFKTMKLRRDKSCPLCGEKRTITQLIDYEQFCGIRGEESTTIIQQGPIPAITVGELKRKIDAGHFAPGSSKRSRLIDVREPMEHRICNLPQATLIPLGTIPARLEEFEKDVEYIVHCKMGGRSGQAVALMRSVGLNAINVAGGITAWAREIDPSVPTY